MTNDSEQNDKTRTHFTLTKGTMVSHYEIIEKIGEETGCRVEKVDILFILLAKTIDTCIINVLYSGREVNDETSWKPGTIGESQEARHGLAGTRVSTSRRSPEAGS